jgi:hypothetical protein
MGRIPAACRSPIEQFILDAADSGTWVRTDGLNSYRGLHGRGYGHDPIVVSRTVHEFTLRRNRCRSRHRGLLCPTRSSKKSSRPSRSRSTIGGRGGRTGTATTTTGPTGANRTRCTCVRNCWRLGSALLLGTRVTPLPIGDTNLNGSTHRA